MPIHLDNRDITSEAEGLGSSLIVACNMCAGASLAMKENKPFMQFGSFLKSPPLVRHIRSMQSQLKDMGIKTKWFKGGLIQQFFLCLWTSKQRRKLQQSARKYEAVIVLGCDSAIETVRDTVKGMDCRVIQAMTVGGIMNTKPEFNSAGKMSFKDSKIIPICDRHCEKFKQKPG